MEFAFDIETILKGSNSICVVTGKLNPINLDEFSSNGHVTCEHVNSVIEIKSSCCRNPITHSIFGTSNAEYVSGVEKTNCDFLSEVIDRIGEASARAQSLHLPVTTTEKLRASDHVLLIMKDFEGKNGRGSVVGILKAGRKKLFIVDDIGKLHELNPLCVLDFYVHETRQRMGYGKQLFEALLKVENISPNELAIDRPSPKFIAFLRKHYDMVKTIPQANRFVIFSGFFDNIKGQVTQTPSPIPNQRHSFAGVELGYNSHNGRPHSLAGIEGCFSWSDNKNKDLKNEVTPSREIRSAKRMSHDVQKRNSSSWNVFGVPSTDYSQGTEKS